MIFLELLHEVLLKKNGLHTYIHLYNIYIYKYKCLELQWIELPIGGALIKHGPCKKMKTIKIDTLLLEPITYNLINSNLIDTLCCKFCSILFFWRTEKKIWNTSQVLSILYGFVNHVNAKATRSLQWTLSTQRFFTCVIGIDKVTNFTKRVCTRSSLYPWFFNGFLKLKIKIK